MERGAILINDLVSSTGSKQSPGLSRIDGSIDACSDDNNFLILPSDTEYLTDYLMLLFGQVKRGSMTCTDQSKANRSCKYNLGFLGMRCRNCGGHEKGSYFPSSSKNLQAVSATLHTHLVRCEQTPDDVVRALKMTKARHKYQINSKPTGAQRVFFQMLWERIHNVSFRGVVGCDRHEIVDILDTIVVESTSKTKTSSILNVVSYDEYSGHQPMVSSDDFEVALDLLRMNPTPESNFDNAPDVDITPEPVYQAIVGVSSATKMELSSASDCDLQYCAWNAWETFPGVGLEL